MAILTNEIALITVFVSLHNLDVYASVESRLHSVEIGLNNLEARVNKENDKAKSEISSLEESIFSLDSSVNVSNQGMCSLFEEQDVKLEQVQKTIKQTTDELSLLERDQLAVSLEIKREKKWFRKKLRTWEDAISALSLQIKDLQVNQEKLQNNFQKYKRMTNNITISGCNKSNEDFGRKLGLSESLPVSNEIVRNKYLTRLPCSNGWVLFKKQCYHYDNHARSFMSAREYCRKLNANIADVGSRSESKLIHRLTGDKNTWVGVSDEKEEDVWISERTNQSVAYTNWLRGDPDGEYSQNCVIVGYRPRQYHKWIDAPCDNFYYFVCKKEAIPVK